MCFHPLIPIKRPDRRLIPAAAAIGHPADALGDILRDAAHKRVHLRRIRPHLGNLVLQIEPVELAALVVFAQHGGQLCKRVAFLLINRFFDRVERINKICKTDKRKAAVVIDCPALRNILRLFNAVIMPGHSVDDHREVPHHTVIERLKIRRSQHIVGNNMLPIKKHRSIRLQHHLKIPAGTEIARCA